MKTRQELEARLMQAWEMSDRVGKEALFILLLEAASSSVLETTIEKLDDQGEGE